MKAKAQSELPPREIEVMQLIWDECSTKEIAVKLGISPRTVEAHRWNIAVKLRASSTVARCSDGQSTGRPRTVPGVRNYRTGLFAFLASPSANLTTKPFWYLAFLCFLVFRFCSVSACR